MTGPGSRPREVTSGDTETIDRLQRENTDLRRKLEQSRA
jgi:hypothetical protein